MIHAPAALAEPMMAIDPFVGPARDLGRTGARLAPTLPQRCQRIEPALPFDAEDIREEALDAAREAGALPVRRDRDEQIAAPQQRRRMKAAEFRPILDIDERADGARGGRQLREARGGEIDGKDDLDASELG